MNSLSFWISGFEVRMEVQRFGQPIFIPECHKKFKLEVLQTRTDFSNLLSYPFIGLENILTLIIRTGGLPAYPETQHSIYFSTSWELWQDPHGNLTFKSCNEPPPSQVTITPDYSRGEVLVDLTSYSESTFYPLANLESRLFSVWLASNSDFIMHASGVSVDGEGYCFLGDSGVGKSTLAAVLAKKSGVIVLGEDQVILRHLDGRFWIFGTPWHKDPEMCDPLGVPLKKMFFLDRNLPPGATSLKPIDGVARLLRIALIPYHLPKHLPGILDRIQLLSEQIPFLSLSYRLDTDPWLPIFNA